MLPAGSNSSRKKTAQFVTSSTNSLSYIIPNDQGIRKRTDTPRRSGRTEKAPASTKPADRFMSKEGTPAPEPQPKLAVFNSSGEKTTYHADDPLATQFLFPGEENIQQGNTEIPPQQKGDDSSIVERPEPKSEFKSKPEPAPDTKPDPEPEPMDSSPRDTKDDNETLESFETDLNSPKRPKQKHKKTISRPSYRSNTKVCLPHRKRSRNNLKIESQTTFQLLELQPKVSSTDSLPQLHTGTQTDNNMSYCRKCLNTTGHVPTSPDKDKVKNPRQKMIRNSSQLESRYRNTGEKSPTGYQPANCRGFSLATNAGPPATITGGPPAKIIGGPPAKIIGGPPAKIIGGPPAKTIGGPPTIILAGPPTNFKSGGDASKVNSSLELMKLKTKSIRPIKKPTFETSELIHREILNLKKSAEKSATANNQEPIADLLPVQKISKTEQLCMEIKKESDDEENYRTCKMGDDNNYRQLYRFNRENVQFLVNQFLPSDYAGIQGGALANSNGNLRFVLSGVLLVLLFIWLLIITGGTNLIFDIIQIIGRYFQSLPIFITRRKRELTKAEIAFKFLGDLFSPFWGNSGKATEHLLRILRGGGYDGGLWSLKEVLKYFKVICTFTHASIHTGDQAVVPQP